VTSDWSSYDAEDYVERVQQMDAAYDRLNETLVKALQKNRRGVELTRELLRRAELKATASEEQKLRQDAAIRVLGRLLRHFEADE
jgi:hypothetical protein